MKRGLFFDPVVSFFFVSVSSFSFSAPSSSYFFCSVFFSSLSKSVVTYFPFLFLFLFPRSSISIVLPPLHCFFYFIIFLILLLSTLFYSSVFLDLFFIFPHLLFLPPRLPYYFLLLPFLHNSLFFFYSILLLIILFLSVDVLLSSLPQSSCFILPFVLNHFVPVQFCHFLALPHYFFCLYTMLFLSLLVKLAYLHHYFILLPSLLHSSYATF